MNARLTRAYATPHLRTVARLERRIRKHLAAGNSRRALQLTRQAVASLRVAAFFMSREGSIPPWGNSTAETGADVCDHSTGVARPSIGSVAG